MSIQYKIDAAEEAGIKKGIKQGIKKSIRMFKRMGASNENIISAIKMEYPDVSEAELKEWISETK